jgi:demethylmenaquinone methyltransferase/2-methoxy-6-polyprenyl-1,4-benzoquinol methylase
VTLRTAISTPEGKRRYVRRLFATIADRYDFITGFLSYGQDRRWKRRVIELARVTRDDRVLDLACGTGDLLFEAAHARPRAMVGLDVTYRMLELARGRERRQDRRQETEDRGPHPRAAWLTGDMTALPFRSSEFTLITTGYGLRNVPHLDRTLAEIHRVLAPGGRMLSLDFNRPRNPILRTAYLIYLTLVGSALGLALHGDPDTYRYIPESIRNYPGAHGVARMMERQGFVDVTVMPVLFGFMAIHVARKPSVAV